MGIAEPLAVGFVARQAATALAYTRQQLGKTDRSALFAHLKPGFRVLEIGPGEGACHRHWPPGLHYTAVDAPLTPSARRASAPLPEPPELPVQATCESFRLLRGAWQELLPELASGKGRGSFDSVVVVMPSTIYFGPNQGLLGGAPRRSKRAPALSRDHSAPESSPARQRPRPPGAPEGPRRARAPGAQPRPPKQSRGPPSGYPVTYPGDTWRGSAASTAHGQACCAPASVCRGLAPSGRLSCARRAHCSRRGVAKAAPLCLPSAAGLGRAPARNPRPQAASPRARARRALRFQGGACAAWALAVHGRRGSRRRRPRDRSRCLLTAARRLGGRCSRRTSAPLTAWSPRPCCRSRSDGRPWARCAAARLITCMRAPTLVGTQARKRASTSQPHTGRRCFNPTLTLTLTLTRRCCAGSSAGASGGSRSWPGLTVTVTVTLTLT